MRATIAGITIVFKAGSNIATVGGIKTAMPVTALNFGGKLFVPLKSIPGQNDGAANDDGFRGCASIAHTEEKRC
jgi:hypothetical protein